MKKIDVIAIGGAVLDFTFYTDQGKVFSTPENLTAQRMLGFEYGAKISPTESHLTLGGGAANAAVSLTRLGFIAAIATRLGADEAGKEILAKLKKEKISGQFVQLDRQAPTGYSFIVALDKKEREHVIFAERGAFNNFVFKPKDFAGLKCPWLYLTSLSGKDWQKNLKAIFNFAKSRDIKIFWNPGAVQLASGKRVLANFLKQTQILMVNKDEAIELALSGVKLGRKNPNHLNRPIYLLNILQEWGPKLVIITDGKKGAWGYDGKKILRQKILRAKMINTTGVGDAFGSGFLAGLLAEKDVSRALKWGMANSAAVLTRVGAETGLLTRKELLKKVK